MNRDSGFYAIVFAVLCVAFVVYSFTVYSLPPVNTENIGGAAEGRLVWQKYNCQSCHQIYGLGGYLGPDLTNVYSETGKGPVYIRAIVSSGTGLMPAFSLTEQEELQLVQFLRAADRSGSGDPRKLKADGWGMTVHTE